MQKRITLNRIDLTLILSIVIALEGLGKRQKQRQMTINSIVMILETFL